MPSSLLTWTILTGSNTTAGSIANMLNNSTITTGAGGIADFIQQEAFDLIWRRLRHFQMMPAPATGSFTAGTDNITYPSDMLEPFFLCTTGLYFQEIVLKTPPDVISSWSYDQNGNRVQQQPMIYYFDQSTIRFDSPPDQNYAYALLYYQQPAQLSASNTTNFITTTYLRLLKCAVMLVATEWSKEIGAGQFDRTYWLQEFENELGRAQAEGDRSKRSIIEGATFVGGGGIGTQPVYSW